jgi:hypothetical protein
MTAGAFLTIRSMLHEAGAYAEEIAPSTLLAPYTRQYAGLFLGPISWLAPGTLPMVWVRQPLRDAGLLSFPIGVALSIIGGCSGLDLLVAFGILVVITGFALAWIDALWLAPASVEIGDLRTFRDLARVIAEGGDASPGMS